jgi:hypothetical protein
MMTSELNRTMILTILPDVNHVPRDTVIVTQAATRKSDQVGLALWQEQFAWILHDLTAFNTFLPIKKSP